MPFDTIIVVVVVVAEFAVLAGMFAWMRWHEDHDFPQQ